MRAILPLLFTWQINSLVFLNLIDHDRAVSWKQLKNKYIKKIKKLKKKLYFIHFSLLNKAHKKSISF